MGARGCGPCRKELPRLAAAQQRASAVGFLVVNRGESDTVVSAGPAAQGLPLRDVLLNAASRLWPAVGSRGLTTTHFYDAKGRPVGAHSCVLNAAALEHRLRSLRAAR